MTEQLKSKTLNALSWSFVESIGARGVQFVIGIVLARLLLPEQFGLIGMLAIFMAVAQAFVTSGFGAALIQKRHPTLIDTCSVFYFNIVVGLIAAGLLCLVAPWIAAFFRETMLTSLTRALSLTIVINSFGAIHNAMIIKQINFKTLTKVSLIGSLLSGAVGITMALRGFGVWSLAVQQIASSLFGTVLLWVFSTWRPALVFSLKSLQGMFGFGSRILVSGLLDQIFNNIYLVVIGRLFSATELGFYTRANSLQELPSQTLGHMVGRVTFPVFSSMQDDRDRLKSGMNKALTTMALVNFPMMIGLAVVAQPLVVLLLTEKWVECVPYLQLLCVVGLLYPVHLINLNLLQALGRSDLFLRLEIIKKGLIVVNIAVMWRWGISAMISGMIVVSMINFYLNGYYTGRFINYPVFEQARDLVSYLLAAVMMGAVVHAAHLLPFPNLWSMFLVQVLTGVIAYCSLCRILRLSAFMELWQEGWRRIAALRPGAA